MHPSQYPSSWLLCRHVRPNINFIPSIKDYNNKHLGPRITYYYGQSFPDFNSMFRFALAISNLTLQQLSDKTRISTRSLQAYYMKKSPLISFYNRLAHVFGWNMPILKADPDSLICRPVIISPKHTAGNIFAELLTVLRIKTRLTARQAAITLKVDPDDWIAAEQLHTIPSMKLFRRALLVYNRLYNTNPQAQ